MNVCLTTITSDSFVPGTLVMLHSFLKHNSWFQGDVVVYHRELSDESRHYLSQPYRRIKFLQGSDDLHKRVECLVAAFPGIDPARIMFLSLESFLLHEYDKVLYCDSDLLFRRSILELFEDPAPLVAGGDISHYKAKIKNPRGGGPPRRTFNAGLVLIDRTLLTSAHYAGLLDLIAPNTFENQRLLLADQLVLNLYFSGQVHIASGEYNFLLACHDAIEAAEGTTLGKSRVVHFNFVGKPWLALDALRSSKLDPVYAAACGMWIEAYADALKQLAFSGIFPQGLPR